MREMVVQKFFDSAQKPLSVSKDKNILQNKSKDVSLNVGIEVE